MVRKDFGMSAFKWPSTKLMNSNMIFIDFLSANLCAQKTLNYVPRGNSAALLRVSLRWSNKPLIWRCRCNLLSLKSTCFLPKIEGYINIFFKGSPIFENHHPWQSERTECYVVYRLYTSLSLFVLLYTLLVHRALEYYIWCSCALCVCARADV